MSPFLKVLVICDYMSLDKEVSYCRYLVVQQNKSEEILLLNMLLCCTSSLVEIISVSY
jgi:hypothetical protein